MRTLFKILTAGLFVGNLAAQMTLKEAFKDDFFIGAALNNDQFTEANVAEAALVKRQFNSITDENVLKWSSIHSTPDAYRFTYPDRYVQFGETNKMFLVGHTLIWHNQVPSWVFENADGSPVDRDTLLARMRDHIFTVVGRYKGKIRSWDVVNEAVNDNGTLRQSPWLKIIGEEYLVKAFQFAHEADPEAELYYNDFSLENVEKRTGAVALIKKLQAEGVHIDGIGLQGHYQLDWPAKKEISDTIDTFAKLGIKVSITELDVDVLPLLSDTRGAEITTHFEYRPELDPYTNGLPESVQKQLANRYAELFQTFVEHRHQIERVTFWGVTDTASWLNDWPVAGRKNYPLLFGRDNKPKPAFEAVLQTTKAEK